MHSITGSEHDEEYAFARMNGGEWLRVKKCPPAGAGAANRRDINGRI